MTSAIQFDPSHSVQKRQFGLGTAMLLVALVAICLALWRIAFVLAMVYLVAMLPTLFRTMRAITERHRLHQPVGPRRTIVLFGRSLFAVVSTLMSMTCLMLAATLMGLLLLTIVAAAICRLVAYRLGRPSGAASRFAASVETLTSYGVAANVCLLRRLSVSS